MSDTYTINITKTSPDHWIVNTIINVHPYKLETVVGGKSVREGIINSINSLINKIVHDQNGFKSLEAAIRDLESML